MVLSNQPKMVLVFNPVSTKIKFHSLPAAPRQITVAAVGLVWSDSVHSTEYAICGESVTDSVRRDKGKADARQQSLLATANKPCANEAPPKG